MRISGQRPPVATGAARPAAAARRTGAAAPVGQSNTARPVADVSSIGGIPEAELTPKVQAAITMLINEVQSLREQLHQAQQRVGYLEKLADEDTLVPIANRRAFVRELSRMVAYAERYGTGSSILYFDVNGFKEVNDEHGHDAGDAALRRISEILLENLRESDVVGRLGGDEFGIILAQADAATAAEKAAQLASAIANAEFDYEGHKIPLRVSYGAYSFSGGDNAGEALRRADAAMYENKRQKQA